MEQIYYSLIVQLFQTFNHCRLVNPFAANESESIAIGREREMRNLFVAQISD